MSTSFTPPAPEETRPELSEVEQKALDLTNATRIKAEQDGASSLLPSQHALNPTQLSHTSGVRRSRM